MGELPFFLSFLSLFYVHSTPNEEKKIKKGLHCRHHMTILLAFSRLLAYIHLFFLSLSRAEKITTETQASFFRTE